MQFPDEFRLRVRKEADLRYGENPHQSGALYIDDSIGRPCVARAKQLQGKELSFNNIADADAAFECVAEFSEPAAVIVKHMNPCGVATTYRGDASIVTVYKRALACDPVSAFGGIIAVNRPVTKELATELTKIFLEVVVAPSFEHEALDLLKTKPNVRLLDTGGMPDPSVEETTVRSVAGGFLVQTRDNSAGGGSASGGKVVTKRQPSESEIVDMKFAFTVCKHVKSNAIVYAKDGATLGIGAGQMSRIYSAKIAAIKAADAKLDLKGSVLASDAFMPFPDVVEEAAKVGATAIIEPGGSKNDQASIAAADKAGIAMVFTGTRHFRH